MLRHEGAHLMLMLQTCGQAMLHVFVHRSGHEKEGPPGHVSKSTGSPARTHPFDGGATAHEPLQLALPRLGALDQRLQRGGGASLPGWGRAI